MHYSHNSDKEEFMTQKELSYVEDAVSHEDALMQTLNDFISKLQNEELKSFISNEVNVHTTMKNELMHLLEVKANE